MMSIGRAVSVVLVALVATGCGGGGSGSVTGPTPSTGSTPPAETVFGPPVGASQWQFTYLTASAHTCPSTPQTPDDGGLVTITLAADSRTMTLVGVAATTIAIGTLTSDGAGGWTAQKAGLVPGSLVTATFRFSTSRLGAGQIVADRAIFTGGVPCSATWPIRLDRE